jgi:hypothetical protein
MSRLPATPPAGRRRAAGSFPRRRSPRFPQAAPGSAPDPRCPAAAPAAGPLPRGRLRPAGRSWRRRPGCGPELWRDRSAAVRTVGGRPAGHQRLLQLERPEGVDEPCPSASPSGCVATCRTGSRILASRSPRSARWRNASHRRSCPAPASPECREALPSLRRGPADAAGGSGPAVRRRRAADANLRADAARGQGARRRLTRLPRSCRGRATVAQTVVKARGACASGERRSGGGRVGQVLREGSSTSLLLIVRRRACPPLSRTRSLGTTSEHGGRRPAGFRIARAEREWGRRGRATLARRPDRESRWRGPRCLLARRRRQPVVSCPSSRTWRRSRGPCEGPRDKPAESEDLGSFGARKGSNVHVAS